MDEFNMYSMDKNKEQTGPQTSTSFGFEEVLGKRQKTG